MKIKIRPDQREKYQAALADLAAQCDDNLRLSERAVELLHLNDQVRVRVEGLSKDLNPTDDKAVMGLILERERAKIVGQLCSAVQWDLEHREDAYHQILNEAAELVSGPVNDVAAQTAVALEEKLKATVGAEDARKFGEAAAEVQQVRTLLVKKFVSENTRYDMHLEACQRIRIFLEAYLSDDFNHAKVFEEMNAVGRAA